MEEKKLVKVVLEYDTEVVSINDPEEAKKWLENVNSICAFMENREMNPFKEWQPHWTIVKK